MESFELEVEYKGEMITVPAKLVTTGFGYKIMVTANEQEISFERDDENKWRAVLPYSIDANAPVDHHKTDKSFIAAIGQTIETTFP